MSPQVHSEAIQLPMPPTALVTQWKAMSIQPLRYPMTHKAKLKVPNCQCFGSAQDSNDPSVLSCSGDGYRMPVPAFLFRDGSPWPWQLMPHCSLASDTSSATHHSAKPTALTDTAKRCSSPGWASPAQLPLSFTWFNHCPCCRPLAPPDRAGTAHCVPSSFLLCPALCTMAGNICLSPQVRL